MKQGVRWRPLRHPRTSPIDKPVYLGLCRQLTRILTPIETQSSRWASNRRSSASEPATSAVSLGSACCTLATPERCHRACVLCEMPGARVAFEDFARRQCRPNDDDDCCEMPGACIGAAYSAQIAECVLPCTPCTIGFLLSCVRRLFILAVRSRAPLTVT